MYHTAKTTRAVSLCLAALLLQLASCQQRKFNLPTKRIELVLASGASVFVEAEIATKSAERNWGFMERKKIPDGTGMLFVFEDDRILSFWMKNTPHPLSIAYIDSHGTIRDIFDMTPYSLSPVKSSRSVRYALEVPQGWFDKVGVKVGDELILDTL